jgi:hypothetical protein
MLLADFSAFILRASNPDIFFEIFLKCLEFGQTDEFEKPINGSQQKYPE